MTVNHDSIRPWQMFGFDVLVDRKRRPYLLEVNFAPSLNTGSALDLLVKSKVRKTKLATIVSPHTNCVPSLSYAEPTILTLHIFYLGHTFYSCKVLFEGGMFDSICH